MNKNEIQNLIKELIEKTSVSVKSINLADNNLKGSWFEVEVDEPYHFVSREGEALSALNHLVRRIIEKNTSENVEGPEEFGIMIDINGFQKKRIENIQAMAHMMAERARYFKSNIEVDPMSAFERRVVHEFLADAPDLKTESQGVGRDRRVVIKYIGSI